jgi:DNA-binding response OmpR family regulator
MSDSTRPPGVLIVDDDAAVRRLLETALTGHGFAVIVAKTGSQAVELLRSHTAAIGVVLLDVLMPDMDGPATLRELRRIRPGIPICYHTAFSGDYSEDELLAPGACALVIKPCPLDKLIAALKALLHGRSIDGAVA